MEKTNFYASCSQCPRKCKTARDCGKIGFCGETNEVKIAVACLHFGEEPPITKKGGSGTIFITGCTLRCAFCQNYQISQNGMGKTVNNEEFTQICLKLQNAGAENINIVTGSHCIPKLAEYIEQAQNAGCKIPFCWNSSAYENVEMLELLKPYIKIWLPDLKTLSAPLAKKLFNAEDYPQTAQKAILWMLETNPSCIIIRHLFLPGHFEETVQTLEWLKKNADGRAIISLMNQYTPVPFEEEKTRLEKRQKSLELIENRLVNSTEDADLQDIIEAFEFEQVFYQELSDDTSWLPDFRKSQPFSNALAKPIWHWQSGFLN